MAAVNYQQHNQGRWLAYLVLQVIAHRLAGAVQGAPNVPQAPYFAVCVVIKNQQLDVREWVEYYRWLGADQLYIYDHNSSPPLLPLLRDVVASGFVEYSMFGGHHISGGAFPSTAQGYAYDDCLRRTRGRVRWLAFFDTDEFLVIKDSNVSNIKSLLQQYEEYAGLGVNWVLFGSSNQTVRPAAGVLASYTSCLPLHYDVHRHVKVIVNPSLVASMVRDPHHIEFSDPSKHFLVDEQGRNVTGHETETPTHQRMALHHYFTKSAEEWTAKMKRGSGDGGGKTIQTFNVVNSQAVNTCAAAVTLAQKCCPSLQGGNATWLEPIAQ